MHSDRDVARIVRSWLHTGEHESSDRVLDTVLRQLDTTPQRRSWWAAWRITDMHPYVKFATATAAVVVVAVVGLNMLSAGGGFAGAPTASPSPSPTPTPNATPIGATVFPVAGDVAIGRHDLVIEGVSFSIDVPMDGWTSHPSKTGGTLDSRTASLFFWSPDGVFADPCGHVKSPVVGPGAKDLASAMATVPGTDRIRGSSDIAELFGATSKFLSLKVREDVGCDPEDFYLWYDLVEGERYATELGSTIRLWIVEKDGVRFVIEAESYENSGLEVGAHIHAIVDSILFK